MSVTIDSLDIQIRSSAGSAANNIDDLAKALGNLNSNAKVTKIVHSLEKLNTTLGNLKANTSTMSHLSAMSKSLASLAAIPKLTGLRSAINELKKLPAVMQNLDTAQITQFAAKMKLLANGLAPLATQIDKIGRGFSKLPTQISRVVTATNRLNNANKAAAKSAGAHGAALNGQSINLLATYEHLSNVFGMMHGVQDAFSKLLNDAIQWDGIQFQFGRAFGEDAEEVLAYAEKVSKALKINQQQFMESASLYGSLLKGFGVEQDLVTTMGVGLAELSYDIWAAYNNRYRTLEDASEAVRSAITGEIEPIRNAGIALTEASMQEYLDSVGMAHISMEKLTEAQKSEVRYATMVNAAMNQGIIGTYAREMETAEGAVRTLTQQLKTLGQAFGSLFIPMLKMVLPWISAFVELITEGVIALGAMFGIKFQQITWDSAAGMAQTAAGADATASALGDAAKNAKAMKDYTMGFDELNVIDPSSASSGGASGGAGGIGSGDSLGLGIDTLWDDAVLASASKQVDELKQKIKDYIEEHKLLLSVVGGTAAFLGFMKVLRGLNSLLGITKTVSNLKMAFAGISKASAGLKTAASNVKAFFSLLKSGAGLGGTLAAAFPKAANILSSVSTWVTGTFIPAFKSALTKVPTLLINAVKAHPWVATAVAIIAVLAAAIKLAVTDYDFTDIGYKIGEALGSALKKVGEWLGNVGDWIVSVKDAIVDGINAAWKWVKDEFDIDNVFELVYVMFNPAAWVTKIVPKMIEIGKEVLPGLWEGVKKGWKNFWGNVEEFIDGFIDGFKDGLGIHSPSTVFADIGENIIAGLINGVSKKWNDLKTWFNTTVAPKFTKSYWAAKYDTIRTAAESKLNEVKSALNQKWSDVKKWYTTNVAPKFTADYWKTQFDTIRSALKTKLDEAWKAVTNFFSVSEWKKKVTDAMDTVKKNFKIPSLPKIRLEVSWDTNVGAIKKAVYEALGLPGFPKLSWNAYAMGGFPSVGEMFIAREAGPEMVGRIGSRTTVANNDQIVEGITAGVYQAVVAAMNNSQGRGGQSVNVYLDGKQIYASVKKTESERGVSIMGNQLGYAY